MYAMNPPVDWVLHALRRNGLAPRPAGPDAWSSRRPAHAGAGGT